MSWLSNIFKKKEPAGKGWKFSRRSKQRLKQVHPDLIRVINRALELSPIDFGITSGVRTAEEQNALYNRGASKLDGFSRKSKHQIQPSGYGEALDFCAFIGRRASWEMPLYFSIIEAIRKAAKELDVPVRTGSCWKILNDTNLPIETMVRQYIKEKDNPFVDACHVQLELK